MPFRRLIDGIETLIHEEVGRNATALFAAARGGLFSAATALAADPAPRVGLLTGFYVPLGDPPAAETDGPAAAALLARALAEVSVRCRIATDTACASACQAALAAAGVPDIPVDPVTHDGPVAPLAGAWQSDGIGWIVAIERAGPSAGGPPRNMRGQDISRYVAPLHELFLAGGFRTIAIGDGGNEIGMGTIPRQVISQAVPHGETIACTVLRPDWREGLLRTLDPALDAAIVANTVEHGPAVDGVTLRREATIDRLGMDVHAGKLRAVRRIAEGQ
jgi:hypothetical protein